MAAGESIRLLVVDDIPTIRENLVKLLSLEADIEVVGAAVDGKDGIAKAHELSPDVVLMDINMPVIDGLTATGQLAEDLPNIRVILMSVQYTPDYLDRAWQAGALDYLVEPFSGDELMTSVRFVAKVATNEELPVFRRAGATYDALGVALSAPDFVIPRVQAWLTLIGKRYTSAWAVDARLNPAKAPTIGVDDLVRKTLLAKGAESRAKEANLAAQQACEIARRVVAGPFDALAIHRQCVIAAQAFEVARSASEEIHELEARILAAWHAQLKLDLGGANTRVLVVEGHWPSQRLLRLLLERAGFEVSTAASGLDCLDQLRNSRPALVTMDISSSVDGVALMRQIRAKRSPATAPPIKIVAVTAHAMPGDREKILAAGFDGYIAKPVDPQRFADDVKHLLENGNLPRDPTPLQPRESNAAVFEASPKTVASVPEAISLDKAVAAPLPIAISGTLPMTLDTAVRERLVETKAAGSSVYSRTSNMWNAVKADPRQLLWVLAIPLLVPIALGFLGFFGPWSLVFGIAGLVKRDWAQATTNLVIFAIFLTVTLIAFHFGWGWIDGCSRQDPAPSCYNP